MRKKYYKTENRKAFFAEMVEKFGDQCMICHQHIRHLLIDHDHQTGIMRGLLCVQHNFGLGNFQDSPELLRKAANYLETMNIAELTNGAKNNEMSGPVRKPYLTNQDIDDILLDKHYKSDRQRAKELTVRYNISFSAAQSRVSRRGMRQCTASYVIASPL